MRDRPVGDIYVRMGIGHFVWSRGWESNPPQRDLASILRVAAASSAARRLNRSAFGDPLLVDMKVNPGVSPGERTVVTEALINLHVEWRR